MFLVWVSPLKVTGLPGPLSSHLHPQGLLAVLSAQRKEGILCPGLVAGEGGMQGTSSPWGRLQGDHFPHCWSSVSSSLIGNPFWEVPPALLLTPPGRGLLYLEHGTLSPACRPPPPKKFLGMLYCPMHESSLFPAFILVHVQH